jgi:site-specific DNA-methyltransferase (adenine-specific)
MSRYDADSVLMQQTPGMDQWATPKWLYAALDREFGFTLDPCSDLEKRLCAKWYTILDNGLLRNWATETVFMNPPYSETAKWMGKAYGAAQEGATVVCLVPARTDTVWWHEYAMTTEIRLIRGRLKFGSATWNAPFPSAIIVFRPPEFPREFKLVSYEEPRRPPIRMGR